MDTLRDDLPPATPKSQRSFASMRSTTSRRSPFAASLRKASRPALAVSKVFAEPQLAETTSERKFDTMRMMAAADTKAPRGVENGTSLDSNDDSVLSHNSSNGDAVAVPELLGDAGGSQVKRTASVGWLTLRAPTPTENTKRTPTISRKPSRNQSMTSSVETIKPTTYKKRSSSGVSVPPSYPVVDISSPVEASTPIPALLSESPKQETSLLPPTVQTASSVPSTSTEPLPPIIADRKPSAAPVSSSSGTTASGPARSNWFSSIRRTSLPRHTASGSGSSNSSTIKPRHFSSTLATTNTATREPTQSPNSRPAIPRFTPPPSPPNGEQPTSTSSLISEKNDKIVATSAVGASTPLLPTSTEVTSTSSGPSDMSKPAPSPVRGWFGSSKTSLVSRSSSPSRKGKEKEKERPAEIGDMREPDPGPIAATSTITIQPPPTVESQTTSPKVLSPGNAQVGVAELQKTASTATRGWFGSTTTSRNDSPSRKGKEKEHVANEEIQQPNFAPAAAVLVPEPMNSEPTLGATPPDAKENSATIIEEKKLVIAPALIPPPSRGWFGSSRASSVSRNQSISKTDKEIGGGETSREDKRRSTPLAVPSAAPTSPIAVPQTQGSSAPTSSRATPVSRGWFGSSKTSLAAAELQGSGAPASQGASTPPQSVIVSEQPVTTSSILPPVSNAPEESATSVPSFSEQISPPPVISTSTVALNPASGRFTLGLPLLGGRRKAADKAIEAIATKEGIKSSDTDASRDTSISNGGTATSTGASLDLSSPPEQPAAGISTSASSPAVPATNPESFQPQPRTQSRPEAAGEALKAGDEPSSTRDPDPNVIDGTWWSYFGLGGGPLAPPPPVNLVQTPAAVDERSPARTASSSASIMVFDGTRRASSTSREIDGASAEQQRDNTEGQQPAITSAGRAQSVTSGETAASSGWMGPLWAWAYPVAEPVADTAAPEKDEAGGVTSKTEAELVKEEALRDTSIPEADTTTAIPSSSDSDPNASPVSTTPNPNPVVAHAATKTWMSFFSSRNNLAVKRLTDGHQSLESTGMEVMDVPDDDALESVRGDGVGGSMASPPRSRTASNERVRAESPTDSDARGRQSTKSPISSSADLAKRKIGMNAPPSPISKSNASTRNASPASSTKVAGKEKDRKQNYVLPTFGDTFYTLPRVMPPSSLDKPKITRSASQKSLTRRAASGLTKKTLNLVTSWLGPTYAPQQQRQPTASQGRQPSEEMVRYLEERRERIARSWMGKAASPTSTSPPPASSLSPTGSSPTAPPGSSLTVASGSGSEHPVSSSSLLGINHHSVPIGRIAHKGHHHLGGGPGGHVAAATMAKNVGKDLPRIWDVLEDSAGGLGELANAKRVVVIGIHGWFPGAMIRTVLGEPTGTSSRLASMMGAAVEDYVEKHGIPVEKLTLINLEGEGTIARRVAKLYQDLLDHPEWVEDVRNADVMFIATHSQGSIVSTQLLSEILSAQLVSASCRVAVLALCGIHLGPLLYLNTSSLTQPYFTYFETAAARELFEFQDTSSEVSQRYVKSLEYVLERGVKMVYIASLDDQVVPIYSGTFMTASHPLILRSLYIDGDAYSTSEFITLLLVFLLRVRNAGLDDGGLITHLSEATAGSLSGVGHSTPYLHRGCYDLAVRFLFETSGVLGDSQPEFRVDPFQARATRNDYEIPWALRGVISDPAILSLFASEIAELRQAFDDWAPKTSILKDLRRKLEPIQSLRILPPSPLGLHSHQDEGPPTPHNSKL